MATQAQAVTVKTRKADGTTNPDVAGKVIPIVVVMPDDMKKAETKAVTYWNGLEKKAKQTIDSLRNLGMVLKAGKDSVNNNNQVFSKWRVKRFKDMTARFCSYAIQLSDNYPEILESFNDLGVENRLFTNPESVINAWKRISGTTSKGGTPESADDDDDETVVNTDTIGTEPEGGAPEVVSLETLTPEKRIETLGESLNMVIETFNSDGWNEEQVKDIVQQLDNALNILSA